MSMVDVNVLHELTPRQRAVVQLVLSGLTRREIAQRLDRSLKVVEGHLTAAFKTLGVSSTTELRARFAGAADQREGVSP